MAKPSKEKFEDAMKRLEDIVKDMEAEHIPLEDAIAKFEEGVKLSKYCANKLDEAEQKMTILLKNADGEIAEKPFGAP